jgi:hypothetical protein
MPDCSEFLPGRRNVFFSDTMKQTRRQTAFWRDFFNFRTGTQKLSADFSNPMLISARIMLISE